MEEKNAALEALEKAIGIEMDGRQFYVEAAERSTNQRGKEMFLSLAHDEETHLLVVEKQYVSLFRGEGWQALVETPGEVDLETPLFPKGKEALEKIVRPKDSDLDALVLAMGFETDSYELYSKGYAETDEPNGKAMYKYLANMERGHFEILMSNYEYLSRTGHWHGG
jgi:rubrerythrin